ncbi:MAG: hypothetical protein Q8880_09960 [Bacteroidota bacterium]|nr:hypothetical protein [Bacteroidota bacterium]
MKILIFLTFLIIAISTYSQRINLNDSVIKCGSVAGLKIGDNIDNVKLLNSDFIFQPDSVCNYGIEGEEEGLLVIKNLDTLLFMWKKESSPDLIAGFCILSDRFVTSKNTKIGSTVADFIKKDKDFYLSKDYFYDLNESYYPPDLNKSIGDIIITTAFEFFAPQAGTIGKYKTDEIEEKTKKFNDKEIKLRRIHIFKWN